MLSILHYKLYNFYNKYNYNIQYNEYKNPYLSINDCCNTEYKYHLNKILYLTIDSQFFYYLNIEDNIIYNKKHIDYFTSIIEYTNTYPFCLDDKEPVILFSYYYNKNQIHDTCVLYGVITITNLNEIKKLSKLSYVENFFVINKNDDSLNNFINNLIEYKYNKGKTDFSIVALIDLK